jgi:DNA-binding protein HU-beta
MSKKELIDAIAAGAELTKEKAGVALDAMIRHIESTLSREEEVAIPPLGKFKISTRKARIGRNPATKQEIRIPASNVPRFQPSKSLKDAVNKR